MFTQPVPELATVATESEDTDTEWSTQWIKCPINKG